MWRGQGERSKTRLSKRARTMAKDLGKKRVTTWIPTSRPCSERPTPGRSTRYPSFDNQPVVERWTDGTSYPKAWWFTWMFICLRPFGVAVPSTLKSLELDMNKRRTCEELQNEPSFVKLLPTTLHHYLASHSSSCATVVIHWFLGYARDF